MTTSSNSIYFGQTATPPNPSAASAVGSNGSSTPGFSAPEFGTWGVKEAARLEAAQTEKLVALSKGLIQNYGKKGATNPEGKSQGLRKFFSNFVSLDESALGASSVLFLQDTLSVWLPKMTAVRSAAEAVESTFLEFVESALFYFSAPILGQHLFSHLIHNTLPDNKVGSATHVARQDIAANYKHLLEAGNIEHIAKNFHTLSDATAKQTKKLVGFKAGTILATMSAMLLEYSLSFAKNLITLKFFKTGNFTDVANLTNQTNHAQEDHPTAIKAKNRMKQGALAAGGILAASIGLAHGATRSKTLFKASTWLVKHFDFNFTQAFKRVGKPLGERIKGIFSSGNALKQPLYQLNNLGKRVVRPIFGLSRNQKYAIVILGGLGYLDASRDKLEVYENLFRVWGVVMPYLMFGKDFLTERFRRIMHGEVHLPKVLSFLQPGPETIQRFQSIYKWDTSKNHGKGGGAYLSHNEIIQKALASVPGLEKLMDASTPVKSIWDMAQSNDPKLRQAFTTYQQLMKPKTTSFVAPLAFGIFVVGLTVAWLNRYWTNYRFNNMQKKQQEQAAVSAQHVTSQLPPSAAAPVSPAIPGPITEFVNPSSPLVAKQINRFSAWNTANTPARAGLPA